MTDDRGLLLAVSVYFDLLLVLLVIMLTVALYKKALPELEELWNLVGTCLGAAVGAWLVGVVLYILSQLFFVTSITALYVSISGAGLVLAVFVWGFYKFEVGQEKDENPG